MSALPPKADIQWWARHVRIVPKGDILRRGKERRYPFTSSARANMDCGIVRPSEGMISCYGLCPLSGHAALEIAQPNSSI